MPQKIVQFSPYEPDRARYAINASDSTINALPTADGWGPLPSLEAFTEALAAEPRGSYTGVAPDGTIVAFAGTAGAIYKLAADGTFDDVKSGAYNLPTGDSWSFDTFGSRVIVTNIADGVEYWDIGSSTVFATLSGSPPAAKHVAVISEFVFLGNQSGAPNKITWSGLGNTEQWTSGEELSASRTFPDGGAVQGIIPVTGGALIFQERVIRSAQYVPESGFTFAITYFDEKRGCVAPRSIVKIGANDFVYLSRQGFFRGTQPIGAERVDDTFFASVDADEIESVEGSADPKRKIVWWRFKGTDAGYYLIAYNWQLDRWFYSDADVQSMAVMASSAVTLEDLDTLYPGGMDSVMLNTDSDALGGGTLAFAGFNSSYQLGYFTGVAQAATLETATTELNPGARAFVREVSVIGDVGDNYTAEIGSADFLNTAESFGSPVTPSSRTAIAKTRKSGRTHRFRINVPQGVNWSDASAVRVDYTAEGRQ